MFLTLLSKELRTAMLTYRFTIAFITIFILIVTSFWVQADSYTIHRNNYTVELEKSSGEDADIRFPSHAHPTVYKRPSPLSIFAVGDELRLGGSTTLWRWQVPREANGSFSNNDYLASLKPFDLLTIISLVVSLFSIMLAFDGISKEREQGTLRLKGTCPVSRATILSAKFVGIFLTIAIPILISFLSGLIVLLFIKNISFTSVEWIAVALLAISSLLYSAIFVGIGMLGSVIVKHSSVSLLLGLLSWLLLSLVIPVFTQAIAEFSVPVASTTEFTSQEMASLAEAEKAYQRFSEEYPNHAWGYWTSSYGPKTGLGSNTKKIDGLPVFFSEAIEYIRFMEPYMLKRADQMWNAYQKIVSSRESQAGLAAVLSLISPAQQLETIFTSLAGTDYPAHKQFMESARRYRQIMISQFESSGYFSHNALAFFSRRTPEEITEKGFRSRMENLKKGLIVENLDSLGPLPDSQLPLFAYNPPAPPTMKAGLAITAQLVIALLLFICAFWGFLRYDIR